ncbi:MULTISPECIES: TonB-dependent receptor [Flavobacteriaceae]|uniref:SusC/RagA family TonB-linked outer membrane protein n=1 Tax=Flavobacteriaceae TaxID=49546 RepID=UPI0010ADA6FE|nr:MULTISPECIES: TonB-dependent receptor [Flavobacteriaceae]NJB37886.1 TonB-dependent receptor [Croceivirga sp. JEA036]TKD60462.1 TonB-dependent receptor [Flavobacterium sp. ASW18X]
MKSMLTWLLTPLLVFTMSFSFAQEKTISGNVTDQDGLPLPGVSIVVVGTSNGTQTDFDGNYSITASTGQVLRFSYLGQKTVNKTVGTSSTINAQLEQDAQALAEVVVTGYGGGQDKSKIASAITTVGSETIESRPNASFVQTLQSQAPGMQISTGSGQPGSNSTILIRGVTSLSGNVEPLFIMDGVPIDEDNFRSINPNDIESINILKDGSASALYGSRGAAGVIVIKTKSGKFNSAFKVTYRTQTGFTSPQDPNFETMTTDEIINLERLTGNTNFDAMSGDPARSFLVSENINTNWSDIITQTGKTILHELSLTSGSENASNYNSISYYEQEGTARRSNLQRFTFRTNYSGKSNDNKFTYGSNFTANFSKSNFIQNEGTGSLGNPFLVAYLAKPYLNPFNPDGSLNTVGLNRDGFDVTPFVSLNNTQLNTQLEEEIKVVGSFNASLELLKNVRATTSFGADFTQTNDLIITSPLSIYGQNAPNPDSELKGSQFEGQSRDLQMTSNLGLNYSNTFADKHTFDISGFVEFNQNIFDRFGFTGYGIDPRLEGYNFAPGDLREFPDVDPGDESLDNLQLYYIPDVFSTRIETSLFSYFGLLNYDYDGKYGVDLSLRRDASSRFSSTNKWGTFWSAAARWNISKENFLVNSNVVDDLKLRVSYGTSGNDRITGGRFGGTTLTNNLYAVGNGYNASQAIVASSLANPDLKWETTEQYNIGLDFGLFNKLSGTFDLYDKRTSDLFYATPNTLISTFGSISRNIGSMSNKGVEVSLNADVVDTDNFKFSVNANAAWNKNEITELLDGELIESGRIALQEGKPFNSFYAVRWAGVNPANGQPIYLDKEGNPTSQYNPDDRVFVDKGTIPEFTGGFGFNADYKGLTLSTLFSFVGDVYRYNNAYGVAEDPTLISLANQSSTVNNIWTTPGDITDIPAASAGSTRNLLTDRYLENAGYLRLRNVTLAYNLQSDLLEKTPFSSVRVYLQGENLITWTEWRGFDPEADALRVQDFFNYPTPRILTLGLDIQF